MTVTAPPRPPRPDDPVKHGEFEALVEALIEEARQRTRRRRRRNAAVVTLTALVGVALFATLGRSAQSQTAAPALSARSSLPGATAPSKIAFINEGTGGGYCGTVWVMNPDGSAQRRLTNGGVPGCGQEWDPALSPDGRQIAFVSGLSPADPGGRPGRICCPTIYVTNVDGSGQRELTRDNARESSPAWSPDGQRIAFLSSGIRVVNADGNGLRRLTRKGWGDSTPAWSPDGRRIAFVSRRDDNLEIYAMNADGSGQRRLTRNTVRDSDPVWSPDGRRIAFVSGWRQVYVMNANGSEQRELTRGDGRNLAPSWSPNGRRIAFSRSGVYVINADGTEEQRLSQDGEQPSWSPDGRKIAFERNLDIYIMNADGSGQRKLTRGADRESQPVWSPTAQK